VNAPAETPVSFTADERTAMLEALYRAFNERDIDAALDHLAPGVDWPNAATGERLHGRDAVKAYWQKQWQEIDPTVEPMRINIAPDGKAHVLVDQLVRALDGEILQNLKVEHVFEFDGPFISRMTTLGLAEGEVDHRDRDDDDADGEDGGEGGGDQGGEGA
jgi:limonene-1,2-epoxide hydrolase